jgi:hypothetical protein
MAHGQQSRRGLGDTDGFAFVPHAGAAYPGRHPLGVGTEKSPNAGQGRFPARPSESYVMNSADYDPQSDNAAKP